VAGQDGSYLAELLMRLGYEVHGLTKSSSTEHMFRIRHLSANAQQGKGRLVIHHVDITDLPRLGSLLGEIRPNEIYNLAAQSHIVSSHNNPQAAHDINAKGAEDMFETVRLHSPDSRVYQASSSEMFGDAPGPQNEETLFSPQTPYGFSKLYAHRASSTYRDKHGLFVASGILFNHESPRRSDLFVTRKITRTAYLIHKGLATSLELGDLEASRDWGYAPDYVFAMWRMLQIDNPQDFVISTGVANKVRAFAREAFMYFGLDWRHYVQVNSAFLRPTVVSASQGDSSKARDLLGWNPSVDFSDLVELMCEAELHQESTLVVDEVKSLFWPSKKELEK
jgi:GDPmannose 4,6-dehydratase